MSARAWNRRRRNLWGTLPSDQVEQLKAEAYEVYEACVQNHTRLWHRDTNG